MAGTIANVDNDTWFQRVAEVRLGATGGLDATTSGSVYFDNLQIAPQIVHWTNLRAFNRNAHPDGRDFYTHA
ncbi:MAG: hypothetical protein IPG44_15360 [Anaerolineales bacterium]|nr:hypothetical protein [Anaerolineales bacterium]